jgi:hypothetical protein
MALDAVIAEHTNLSPSMFGFCYADRTAIPVPYPTYFNEASSESTGLSLGERYEIPSVAMLQTSNTVLPELQLMHGVLSKVPAWCLAEQRVNPDHLKLSDAWEQSSEHLMSVVSAYGGGTGHDGDDSDLDG